MTFPGHYIARYNEDERVWGVSVMIWWAGFGWSVCVCGEDICYSSSSQKAITSVLCRSCPLTPEPRELSLLQVNLDIHSLTTRVNHDVLRVSSNRGFISLF